MGQQVLELTPRKLSPSLEARPCPPGHSRQLGANPTVSILNHHIISLLKKSHHNLSFFSISRIYFQVYCKKPLGCLYSLLQFFICISDTFFPPLTDFSLVCSIFIFQDLSFFSHSFNLLIVPTVRICVHIRPGVPAPNELQQELQLSYANSLLHAKSQILEIFI